EEEEETPRKPEDARESDRWTWYAILALLATCLFLLATAIGLGVRYGQVSQQLQRESQNHATQSNLLAQRVSTLEGGLSRSQELLREAERDLRFTRKALEESWKDGNRTQRQLGDQVRQADQNLTHLKQEKEQVERALGQATSCQQMGCCLQGWKIFRWKCLWVSPSSERKSWRNSKEACQARSSHLLILKPWSARELWDGVIAKDEETQQPNEYWIGLQETWAEKKQDWVFTWVDDTPYEGSEIFNQKAYFLFGTLKSGIISVDKKETPHPYICEKAASPEQPFPG
ncbi:B-cell differentiation antigen CD72-like, partial [Lacerta agilis]|uniref:B-cell differentiation antigen CD72-like n=1 Tax=Lacerta agilis TaxID=80427 RepID=UPI00141A1215